MLQQEIALKCFDMQCTTYKDTVCLENKGMKPQQSWTMKYTLLKNIFVLELKTIFTQNKFNKFIIQIRGKTAGYTKKLCKLKIQFGLFASEMASLFAIIERMVLK